MVQRLHEKGIRFLLWQIPVYKKQGPNEPLNAQNELDRADAVARGLCVHNADGSPYTIPEGHWFAGSMLPDFTNPAAEETWFSKRNYLTEMGIDGFKTDGGEFIYREDVRFADGSSGRAGKNRYAQEYTAAYTKHLGSAQALFSRAGYAGQHTTPIHWAGDQQSQNSELASALRAGLSAALTGIPFWGFDIGGFAGPLPTLDLYRRATQLACFVPVMQWHSEPDGGQFRELMPGERGTMSGALGIWRRLTVSRSSWTRCGSGIICGWNFCLTCTVSRWIVRKLQAYDAAAGLSVAGRSAGMGLRR